jgi:outer membrane protein assembly factor BamB
VPLLHQLPAGGPAKLWSIELGEGYAGPAIFAGRVYVLDYDQKLRGDALRCLSLADGREIWRRWYSVPIKRQHGMSRTIPAVTDKYVVTIGPRCQVLCCDAKSGECFWSLDLEKDFGTTEPPWYAGQCPLIDDGKVILAPGGPDALLMAVNCADGKILWKTPNPHAWQMTHSSIVPMAFADRRFYIYCATGGVVGVDAASGTILWETDAWKISMATVPTPLCLPDGRILLTGGYGAGSMMLQLQDSGGKMEAKVQYKLRPEQFDSQQQTPIYYDGYIYGVRSDGQLACLNPDGKVVWTTGQGRRFGLGPFMIADGMILLMNDIGLLTLAEAKPREFRHLSQAKVLEGHDSWAPMALASGRLIVRDLTKMVCLDMRRPGLASGNAGTP